MSNTKDLEQDIPINISDSQVITILQTENVGVKEVKRLKSLTAATDKDISEWFEISEKTFQTFRKTNTNLSLNFKEKLILYFSLYKQGMQVFGSNEKFNRWLDKPNFHFDNERPQDFLTTISGIRYVQDRITGIAHGDNA